MDRTPAHTSNHFVSRILQVALGLFVTTSDLPNLSQNHESLSYDCSFDSECRWASVGNNIDRWRIARGEPDSLLWLAATGTMQLPREPFVLIESRGNPVDSLMTDAIRCQRGYADFSFTYWAIGNADIEICLTDLEGNKFNCTGFLNSNVMPGKVSLKIPELQKPFRVMISPSREPGVIVLDDIRYDASICPTLTAPPGLSIRGRPDFMSTTPAIKIHPWTMRKTSVAIVEPATTTIKIDQFTSTTETPTTTPITITNPPTISYSELSSSVTPFIDTKTTTDIPFDLLILGNRTKPLFDRRKKEVITDSTKLLCDFNNEFACQWGPEAGRWAIIEKGAIPSLENSVADPSLLPTYPAALILQGTALLSSDPIKCQSGPSKVLFRYWSNGDIFLQVCALGYGTNNDIIHCVEQTRASGHEKNSLAIFEINRVINEEFTLNIVPRWEEGLKNRFLVIDEIAYIGECSESKNEKTTTQEPLILGVTQTVSSNTGTKQIPISTSSTETEESTTSATEVPSSSSEKVFIRTTTTSDDYEDEKELELLPETTGKEVEEKDLTEERTKKAEETTTSSTIFITTPKTADTTSFKFTKTPFMKKKPFMPRILTTFAPVYPEELYTLRPKSTKKPSWPSVTTTQDPHIQEDYCDILNCNFDDTACNYLNHGLTKKPWTLRNRGYGFPLTGATDIRATQTNGQFVSSMLEPGDIAILESPKFNATRSLNVLLFQYFRPSQMTTIRLCLGSRYTNPMRTILSFTQCPSILRSVTSKNAYRWNTVHVQLPPGTTHFYLVAHNSERAEQRAAMAIDNMRVAICDTRGFAPDYIDETGDFQNFMQLQ